MTGTQKFEELKHTRRPLSGAGQVVVVDTGALIGAEEIAMLQALHSRSLGGIDSHLLKLAQKGAKNFMETYYVGYGDKSIGDCGTATIFIEGVSMLVAKAIQDFQLYNGQEASTRYIDFARQPFANPHGSEEGVVFLERLRAFHLRGLGIMKSALAERHPRLPDEDEKVWQKAINARSFDVMRSFLPAGAATNLAWHTTLRHAADHLLRLRHHPLQEVRDVAQAVQEALGEMYPSSFKQKLYPATEQYVEEWMKNYYFLDEDYRYPGVEMVRDGIDRRLLATHRKELETRPAKAEPPKYLAECGTAQFRFLLDFGSFRDLQRQRAIIQRMPLLTDNRGFEQWYLDQMPPLFATEAVEFLREYRDGLIKAGIKPNVMHTGEYSLQRLVNLQYYIPMGYRVTCRITGDLPAHIWWVELRSGINVHPTLRKVARESGEFILESYGGDGLVLHLDNTPDRFNYKRGTQDIVEKVLTVS